MLAITGTSVISAAIISTGLGQPIRFFADYEVQNVERLTSFSVIFFIWSGCTARAAAAIFLERSITAGKPLRYCLWAITIGQVTMTLTAFILDIDRCKPNVSGAVAACFGSPQGLSWPWFYISGGKHLGQTSIHLAVD